MFLEHGAEPRAVPCVTGEWAKSARKCVKGQRNRQDLTLRLRGHFQGGLNQRREVGRFIFEKGLLAAVCRDESRMGHPQRPGELPGGYQVGQEGSGMEKEGLRRSKVVFKEGDRGSKRSCVGCREQEVSRRPMDV